jgi:type VI secretion system protein ImpE
VNSVEEQLRAQVRAGDLSGCLADLQQQIRRFPADPRCRVFLAQLLMVTGDYDRAVAQLDVVGELDESALPMVHTYRSAIRCEHLRQSVLRGERSPVVFGNPEPWIALVVQALAALGAGRTAEADALRAEAFDAAPASVGRLNGVEFEWIADADSRFGPILEVLVNGAYYWVPLQRIAAMVVEPPADLRDLVWLPVHLTWTNGGQVMGLVPTRYAGTESAEDSALKLSRRTQWLPIGSDAFAGCGQRMLATNVEEVPLLAVRELTMRPGVDP